MSESPRSVGKRPQRKLSSRLSSRHEEAKMAGEVKGPKIDLDSDDSVKDPNFKVSYNSSSDSDGLDSLSDDDMSDLEELMTSCVNVRGALRDVSRARDKSSSRKKRVDEALTPGVTPSKSGVTPSMSGVTPSVSGVTPSTSDVTPSTSVVTPSTHGDKRSTSDDTPATPRGKVGKSGRKRIAMKDRWGSEVSKKKRNLGESYVSYRTKKEMPARQVGPRCKDGCFDKIGDEKVNEIFSAFWNIGIYDMQNQYLQSLIKSVEVKRRSISEEESRRKHTFHYTVQVDGVERRVCKQAFISIHGISKKKLEILFSKRQQSPTGTPVFDKRGRRPNVRRIHGPPLEHVHEHIQSLPVKASHYSRAHSPHRRYLEQGLTVEEVHSHYVSWLDTAYPGEQWVSPRYYRTVFTTQYNIVSKPPRTDVCNKCEAFEKNIEAKKASYLPTKKLQEDFESHKAAASVPQELLAEAEAKSKVEPADSPLRTVAMDLQQTLPCPNLRVGVAYYKCKVWVYNFCIYDMNRQKANMFIWTETEAKRGADEIASCIVKWIENEFAQERKFKKLRIFCDNCAGQNKNVYIMIMALRLIHAEWLQRVEVVFMVPGHSFMPCDRAFGVIEKKIRKRRSVFCPQDYVQIAATAVSRGNDVFRMQQSDFFHFTSLKSICTSKQTTGISKARQLIVDTNYPEGFIINNSYILESEFPELEKKVRLMPGKAKYKNKNFDLSAADLPVKYNKPLRLSAKKISDLKSLWPYLDSRGRKWVDSVCVAQTRLPEEEDEEAGSDDEAFDADDVGWEYVPVVRLPLEDTN